MAVVNKYVNSLIAANKIANAALVNGARVVGMVATEELAAGDSAGSVYRFFKGVSGNLIPIDIQVFVDDELTEENDADIGLYKQTPPNGDDGAVISANVFADSLDLIPIGGAIRGAADVGDVVEAKEAIDGMKSVDIADMTKKIYEHAGDTVSTAEQGYDICLTANTGITTTGGTVTILALFLEG